MIEQESQVQAQAMCNEEESMEMPIQSPSPLKHSVSQSESSFQKNYPKNIFIPVIEYLAELGLRKAYQACVGTRQKFEGKNVVSLGLIHQLISQSWFIKNVDRQILLANLSNKIMMNSKIKKKLFHLRVARAIFNLPPMQPKEFKKTVSKEANLIAAQCNQLSDQLFEAPNSIIYLLRLFLKTLALHCNLKTFQKTSSSSKKQIDSSEQNIEGAVNGSKEEYKFLVKQISGIFNKRSMLGFDLIDSYQQIRSLILERDYEIQSKFKLGEGVPNWQLFVTYVVDRCYNYRKLEMRITNSCINEWVNQFRANLISIAGIPEASSKWFGAKTFEPIIIQAPSYPAQL